jgi:hypothetical protein
MAEISIVYTLTTPGGTVQFNTGTNRYRLSKVQGLDGAPIRSTIDNVPQGHGGLLHTFFLGPREITMEGMLILDTVYGSEALHVEARNDMEDALLTALYSIQSADGTLTWTRTGGSGKTAIVRNDVPCEFDGGWIKSFVFGLVAANPVIA